MPPDFRSARQWHEQRMTVASDPRPRRRPRPLDLIEVANERAIEELDRMLDRCQALHTLAVEIEMERSPQALMRLADMIRYVRRVYLLDVTGQRAGEARRVLASPVVLG
jgi:hypothetical protein